MIGKDEDINKDFDWVNNFTASVGESLDVVSWHTYDFHTQDLGQVDHQTLRVANNTKLFWNTTYLDYSAVTLNQEMHRIAAMNAPQAQVWLSESNSICHQGTNPNANPNWMCESNSICHQGTSGITNAYLNTIWMVNRWGTLASQNVTVMARQSLIGYNYSLLGNWPVEEIRPNPDYFTTILFRRLFGNTVLSSTLTDTFGSLKQAESGINVRVFTFCSGDEEKGHDGAVAMAIINFDRVQPAKLKFDKSLGSRRDYLLAPGNHPLVENFPWSSREILLNGILLEMESDGSLPRVITGGGRPSKDESIVLPPLTVAFSVFPTAEVVACRASTVA